jgi:3,8-divinyl chlorophyllide a/chlorophyllide a reductase subunit Y
MGPAGAGSLALVVNAAMGARGRMERMRDFFGDAGAGANAGIWEDAPRDRPEFKAKYAARRIAAAKAEEAVGA